MEKSDMEVADLTARDVNPATRALVREACENSEWHLATAITAVKEKLCITHRAAEELVNDEFSREQ